MPVIESRVIRPYIPRRALLFALMTLIVLTYCSEKDLALSLATREHPHAYEYPGPAYHTVRRSEITSSFGKTYFQVVDKYAYM